LKNAYEIFLAEISSELMFVIPNDPISFRTCIVLQYNYKIIMKDVRFEWDRKKATKSEQKVYFEGSR